MLLFTTKVCVALAATTRNANRNTSHEMGDLITARYIAQRWMTGGGPLKARVTLKLTAEVCAALAAMTRNANRNTLYEMVDLITAWHVAHRWMTGGGPLKACVTLKLTAEVCAALAATTRNANRNTLYEMVDLITVLARCS